MVCLQGKAGGQLLTAGGSSAMKHGALTLHHQLAFPVASSCAGSGHDTPLGFLGPISTPQGFLPISKPFSVRGAGSKETGWVCMAS